MHSETHAKAWPLRAALPTFEDDAATVAKRIMADILREHPRMRLSDLVGDVVGIRRQDDLARLHLGLRLAGMPD